MYTNTTKSPNHTEKIEYLLEEFILWYGNYSADHRAEKVRKQLHDIMHLKFEVDLLDKRFNGDQIRDIVGDSKISSCASCFYSALGSDVDRAVFEHFWPDVSSIPNQMASATINRSMTLKSFNWLKERNLLLKIFNSTLVQSYVILMNLTDAYGFKESLQVVELMIDEGFNVHIQQNNWGDRLATKVFSESADLKITQKIFELFWTKFPSKAVPLLSCLLASKSSSEMVPYVLLAFAEMMPKEVRSNINQDKSNETLLHLVCGTILPYNFHILKVIPQLLEILGKIATFFPF